jgi:hypothetical protein
MFDRNGKTGRGTNQRWFYCGHIVVINNNDFNAVAIGRWLVLDAVNKATQQRISLPRTYSVHDMLFIA